MVGSLVVILVQPAPAAVVLETVGVYSGAVSRLHTRGVVVACAVMGVGGARLGQARLLYLSQRRWNGR